MIEIKKGREPRELIEYRKSKFASYDDMPHQVKEVVLDALMQEQGHLCAYCMKRIPQTKGNPPVSIEHWEAQSSHPDKELDYRNMLAVCSGNRGCGCHDDLTCDAKRGNIPLTVNPTIPSTLIGIKYNSDGRISSTNEAVNHDLNDVLNLNSNVYLVPARKGALERLIQHVNKTYSGGDFLQHCTKIRDKILSVRDKKYEFLGILLWWLEKRIKRSER